MRRRRLSVIGARGSVPLSILLLLLVGGFGSAAQDADVSFGGFFEVVVASTQTDALTLEGISIQTSLAIDAYTAQVGATLVDTLSDRLTISAGGPLGEIAVNSTATFNPSTAEFLSWQTVASFLFLDVEVEDVLFVTTPQTRSRTSPR